MAFIDKFCSAAPELSSVVYGGGQGQYSYRGHRESSHTLIVFV